jgi:hypothetical protein
MPCAIPRTGQDSPGRASRGPRTRPHSAAPNGSTTAIWRALSRSYGWVEMTNASRLVTIATARTSTTRSPDAGRQTNRAAATAVTARTATSPIRLTTPAAFASGPSNAGK